MVLEEASTAEKAPSYSADPFASSYDDAVSNNSSTNSYLRVNFNPPGYPPAYVDLAAIRRPWFSSFGALQPRNLTSLGVVFLKNIGRPARQEEAEALVEQLAKIASTRSIAGNVGFLGGLVIAQARGPRSFGIPFPGAKTIDLERLGPLRGSQAAWTWRLIRAGSWAAMGNIVGLGFALLIGAPLIVGSYQQDPRLAEYREIIYNSQRGKEQQRRMEEANRAMPGQGTNETFAMARQRSTVQQQAAQRQRAQQQERRTESPREDRNSKYTSADVTEEPSPETGLLRQESVSMDNRSHEEDDSDYGAQRHRRQQHNEQHLREQAESSSWEFFNSTSNSEQTQFRSERSGSSYTESPKSLQTSSSSGSAWDRLRQQALDETPQLRSSTRASSQGTAQGDESVPSKDYYNFSRSDDQRQMDQAEAQRLFDARLEREREGKNFDRGPE